MAPTSFQNLVNFGPVSTEFKRLKGVPCTSPRRSVV